MSILLKYDCGCTYYHGDDDTIFLSHACSHHAGQLACDALSSFSKRVDLGTSGLIIQGKEEKEDE